MKNLMVTNSATLLQVARSSIVAIILSLLLIPLLRLTNLPDGVRVAVPFFVFMLLQAILLDRATRTRRSRLHWVAKIAFAVAAAIVLGYVAQYDF
jgi:hypothetical protein